MPPASLTRIAALGCTPSMVADSSSVVGILSAIRPVCRFHCETESCVPLIRSWYRTTALSIFTLSISRRKAGVSACGASAAGASGVAPGVTRSSKLKLPSWPLTMLADNPSTCTRSTTTCFDNSGSNSTDTVAPATLAKTVSLSNSDRLSAPTRMPSLG